MANYGKIRIRNLDEDILALLGALTKKGEIGLADLSEELQNRISRFETITQDENTIYIDYNDEAIRNEIQQIKDTMIGSDDIEDLRSKNEKITVEDLDDAVKEIIENAGNSASMESVQELRDAIETHADAISAAQDAIAELEDAGPTRGILRNMYIANSDTEMEIYQTAKLSPIYKRYSGKVFELHIKTSQESYMEEDETPSGAETAGISTDESSSTDALPSGTIEISNGEGISPKVYVSGSEPETAESGDLWFDITENDMDNMEEEDDDLYDEWDVSEETWEEVPDGLHNRNYARNLIYDPIRHHIYYCTYGKLVRIKVSPDSHVEDFDLELGESREFLVSTANWRNVDILVMEQNKNSGDYGYYYYPDKDECKVLLSDTSVRVRNLTPGKISVRIVY